MKKPHIQKLVVSIWATQMIQRYITENSKMYSIYGAKYRGKGDTKSFPDINSLCVSLIATTHLKDLSQGLISRTDLKDWSQGLISRTGVNDLSQWFWAQEKITKNFIMTDAHDLSARKEIKKLLHKRISKT